jgi:hypothetical protein
VQPAEEVRPALETRPAQKVRPALVIRPALPLGPSAARLCGVCLIQHNRDDFGPLGVGAWDYTWCEPE